MVTQAKQKFSSQADPQLLEQFREISEQEGRHFQAVLEEAMLMLIEQRKGQTVRASVMMHYKSSLEKNRLLGELLAK